MIHLCGKGNLDNKLAGITGYAQFEYANAELTDMFALADMAISRAGANSICELLALHKPNILIPLSAAASRETGIKCKILQKARLFICHRGGGAHKGFSA